jgi:Glycosyltransferase family 87
MSRLMTTRTAKDVLGIAALLVAAALVGRHCAARMLLPEAPRDPKHTAGADFRDVIYYPTQAMLAGVNPYDSREDNPDGYRARFPAGNNFPLYSPLVFVPAMPFAVLPLSTSLIVWWLLNAGLTVVLAYVTWRWCGVIPSIAMTSTLAAAILLSRPGHANIYFGQATLLFVLASLAALHWARHKPYLAAVALAMATMKPTFGGPLAILMFCRRDWKAAILGSALGLAAAAIGLALAFSHEAPGTSPLAILLGNQEVTESDPAVNPALSNSRIDAVLVIDRLLGPGATGRMAVSLLILVVSGMVLYRGTARSAVPRETSDWETFERVSSAVVLVTIAGCIYHNIYDALLLVVPAAMLFPMPDHRQIAPSKWVGLVICVLLVVPALSYFSSQQFSQLLTRMFPSVISGAWAPGQTPLLIQLANGCAVLTAWCLLLVVAWRGVGRTSIGQLRPEQRPAVNHEPSEALALANRSCPTTPRANTSTSFISQRKAAPLPMQIVDPKGVRQ